ncbi:enoyl-CoA hydratase-related protein [Hydrogenophaga sp.]|uniref:enoyl-CoA hydratase-related protein n=1 Tax=Hydrogenophaga sp. TaxID=1904254 RepID=UPI00271DBF26|nr:enoyl-CoA hydratase-related protein [Hydrogenophaga sp.]MDO8906553.1 enoyl-CoA hydratase-related protein [Hydrogenophaga sp.]
MTTSHVLFDVTEGIATLILNDAPRMNPLSHELMAGCLKALERVHDDSAVRALLITGAGKAFCVGADLSAFDSSTSVEARSSAGQIVGDLLSQGGNPLVSGLRSLPVPVVCAVNGAAAGGGTGLALAADVVIAARSAFFYLPFTPALGLIPDAGASWLLPRAVGRARAMGLTLMGNRLSAQEAAQWGLIWACVDDEGLSAQGLHIAQKLARLPAHAVQEVRELYRNSEVNTFAQQIVFERERQMELADRPSFDEGVRAFLEKREPRFQSRD